MPGCWERIAQAAGKNRSRLCIGLDVDTARFPEILKREKDPVLAFNRRVVEATLDLVCCYKPNIAFYESLGGPGLEALRKTILHIARRVPVILDCKRGDIGSTARMYAQAAFEHFGADAVTVSPYLGFDSVEPFLKYEDRGVFLLCLTSNPGSADFQLVPESQPLYERVASAARRWDEGRGRLGLVVGATHPDKVGRLREIAGELPFLLPGIGAQGGSLEAVAAAEIARADRIGVVVNASRSVIYAGSGPDFDNEVRKAAIEHRNRIEFPEAKQ
ncbi:MAG: orotidine-5'-phosphate decarboxylase [Candidatus Glassbacteria bacterium]